MKYTFEDYEFALRILHHRKELKEQEVKMWMKDPGHLALLEEIAMIRRATAISPLSDITKERYRLHQHINRRKQLRWLATLAASVMIGLGTWLVLKPVVPEYSLSEMAQLPIVPGSAKARLVLADGKVVNLYSSLKEIQQFPDGKVRNDSVEGLTYSPEGDSVDKKLVYNTLQVPVGGFYRLQLSDGTKVWLNAKSELRFPVHFDDAERHVFLKGEGYFEVARDEQRPFQVHLKQSIVTVLGTTFNISAYADEPNIYTTLVTGAVHFESMESGQSVTLNPGFQCIMENHSGKTTIEKVDTQLYTAWIDGRFIFHFMNLEMIIRQLQRWYDFEVTWLNPEVKAYEFQGVIKRDSQAKEVFKAIELATDVRFVVNGKQVTIEKR